MMTSLQKIQQALTCHTPQKYLPTAPLISAAAGTLHGFSTVEFLRNASIMSDCLLKAQERFGYDAVYAFAGAALEAEAIGSKLDYNVAGYPPVAEYYGSSTHDIPDLQVPDIESSGRLSVVISAIRAMRAALGEDVPVIAIVSGPLTIAIHLRPVEEILYLAVDDRVLFDEILKCTARIAEAVAISMIEAGASSVILGDFAASPAVIPFHVFEESIFPRHAEIVRAIRLKTNALIGIHIPDARLDRLLLARELKPDWLDTDEAVRLSEVRAAIPDTALIGNIRPYLFVNGSFDEMRKACDQAIEAARSYGGIVLGSASEVPIDAKPEQIAALVSAARSYSGT